MSTQRLLFAVVLLSLGLTAAADPPARDPAPGDKLPVGRWSIEFANGVKQECELRGDRTAGVAEPLRIAGGRAEARDGAVVITYDDDRIERWTVVGARLVVEHWFPAAQFPSGTPVRGIGDRIR